MTGKGWKKLAHDVFVFWTLTTICWEFATGQSDTPSSKGKASAPARKQPHIIFVMADDLGFHDVGFKAPELKTPTIDSLVNDGVLLDNYYVQRMCSPTRCTFLSGRYLIHTGLQSGSLGNNHPRSLPRDSPTIADKMKESGYATHAVGKWHAGFHKEEFMPHHRGFDTFYGFLNAAQGYFRHKRSFGNLTYLDFRLNDEPLWNATGKYSTHLFTQRAQDIITAHDKSKPLFLYLAHQAVHAPLQVPREYKKPFKGVIKNRKRQTYAGMLSALDEGIKNVTKTLKDEGMWDDTVLVFSTDNGGYLEIGGSNYPLKGEKFTHWEGGLRAIGFVSGGKNIKLPRGTTSRGLMHVSDWYPTLVGLAGGSLNGTKPLDGVDNWAMLSGGESSKRDTILHNIDPRYTLVGDRKYPDMFDTRVRAAVRVGDYKLITGYPGKEKKPTSENTTENVRLYNIEQDPSETTNLADQKPDVVKRLLVKLGEFEDSARTPFNPGPSPLANPKLHGGVWGPWM